MFVISSWNLIVALFEAYLCIVCKWLLSFYFGNWCEGKIWFAGEQKVSKKRDGWFKKLKKHLNLGNKNVKFWRRLYKLNYLFQSSMQMICVWDLLESFAYILVRFDVLVIQFLFYFLNCQGIILWLCIKLSLGLVWDCFCEVTNNFKS